MRNLPDIPVVVATSEHPENMPLADYCMKRGVAVVRGSEEDVASRFLAVLDTFPFDRFVRVNGDSPLLDTALIERALQIHAQDGADLVTNIFPRTFPRGQSVEVVSSKTFRKACGVMESAEEKEHVTFHFYLFAHAYRITNFTCEHDWSTIHLAVDTQKELDRVTAILARMIRPHWTYSLKEIIDILASLQSEYGSCLT